MNKDEFLFGCKDIKQRFSGWISNGILSHAYLIEGPSGSGKKSLAKYIAASLACVGNCDECNICHRISEGHCPDIKFISREEGQKNISVDAVREMIDDTPLTPTELDFKMYVFDGAEKLSAQAQNSLLKVIEEPPSGVYILLLCESSANILATVKSRVQRVVMPLLSRDEVFEYLRAKSVPEFLYDEKKLDFAVRLSGGAPGKAAFGRGKRVLHISFGKSDNRRTIEEKSRHIGIRYVKYDIKGYAGKRRSGQAFFDACPCIQRYTFVQAYGRSQRRLLDRRRGGEICSCASFGNASEVC